MNLYIHYVFDFNISGNRHCVSLYGGYTPEHGLVGKPVLVRESPRMAEVLRWLPVISKEQRKALRAAASERRDTVILPDGSTRPF